MPRRRDPDLANLATFTLDPDGLVIGWPASATRLFGYPASAAAGRDVCDLLMTSPGQRDLVRYALAEVAAGRVWTATVAGGHLGEGRFAIRAEPLAAPEGGAMVVVQRAWPQPGAGWLTEAAARIGSTLDLDQTASEIVEIAIPGFADAAVLYVAEHLLTVDDTAALRSGQGMAVRRLAARLAGRSIAVADSMMPAGEVVVFGPATPGSQAMTTGKPVLFDQLDGPSAERISRRPGGLETFASYTSFLVMPLAARGTVVGCMLFARTAASPAFSAAELPPAGELASRAAVCIDNARLYHRERRTALALQRGLLPGRSDVPPGLEVAHRYLPVGASMIGGDWHDIIALSGGRAALVVGDAMGHGPEAAAAMVQLRTAAHTLADLELPPAELLCRLDRMAGAIATAPFATCISTVIDPLGGSCLAGQAGHLPPVLVPPGGEPRILDLPPGLPLGLDAGSFEETRISLPPGATLALYTDGLVESRSRPIDEGLAQLRDALGSALATPKAPLDAAAETVTRALCEYGEDDITLVLVRVREA